MLGFVFRHATPIATVLLMAALGSSPSTQVTLRLRGKVLDEKGAPVAGARIRTDATMGLVGSQYVGQRRFEETTNTKGEWNLLGLGRGVWVFEASAPDYLPHVTVVPIFLMKTTSLPTVPWVQPLTLQPVGDLGPADAPLIRAVAMAADQALAGRDREALTSLARLEDPAASPAALCAAGDICLVIRQPQHARGFFERAAKARADWYRPRLGIASAAMLSNDFDTAVATYAKARDLSANGDLKRTLSAAIADLQLIVRAERRD